ncbi:conserved exported hypothetical protein [Candidatus Accumulibacter aalborgensis]|uniref:DUF4230 domain-containing protein n=2 Tax=Candidatus Accumulibacter aalborgensis TaxID=1860102 RepID=A0A1A8XZ87_9PROT|nr:conserved exported hypothetical protein [Candidatus Accumulibacter aalborgensis]
MNVVSRMTWLLSLVGAAALGVSGMWLLGPQLKEPLQAQTPLIALEKMGHLVSVKVNYADVIEFTEKRTQDIPWTDWELRLGGTKVLLVARGDCTIATDLGAARYESVNAQARSVSVILPSPKPFSARVSHEPRENGGSYFYAINSQGIEPIIPDSSNRTQAINNALAHAQQEVERTCTLPDVLSTARKNAEDVLMAIFRAIGWKATLVWK